MLQLVEKALNQAEQTELEGLQRLVNDELKNILKERAKSYIQKQRHPSVWYAIKTISSKTHNKWKSIFEQIPEALTG